LTNHSKLVKPRHTEPCHPGSTQQNIVECDEVVVPHWQIIS